MHASRPPRDRHRPRHGVRSAATAAPDTAAAEPLDTNDPLAARERRWARRLELAQTLPPGAALASLTMRAPWAVRTDPACADAARALFHALRDALAALPGAEIVHREYATGGDGPEGHIAVRLASCPSDARPAEASEPCPRAPEAVKRACIEFEETHVSGAVADVDVMDRDGAQITRAALGLPPRACLVCGGPAAICAAGRIHPLADVESRAKAFLFGS